MPTKAQIMEQRRRDRELREAGGFEVTCTIGRVEFDRMGDMTPFQAAMALIAEHNADGEYRFPNPHGDGVTVVAIFQERVAQNGDQ